MNEQLELPTRQVLLDDALAYGGVWRRVDVLEAITGLSRREIRELASERGYAAGNRGIAKMERLTPEEQIAALRRIEGQAKAMLARRKKMRNIMRLAGTYPLKGIQ